MKRLPKKTFQFSNSLSATVLYCLLGTVNFKIMSKKLKNLVEHNAEASSAQWAMMDGSPRLNGIACPKCGAELYDSNPMVTLTSMPAHKNVHCSKCDYVGYRIA